MAFREVSDRLAQRWMQFLCWAVLSLTFLIGAWLFIRAYPVLLKQPLLNILFSADWRPASGHFGLAAFIIGTLWVTGIAMLLAVPMGIATAVYLAEYAPRPLHRWIRPLIDLLAGISPVIFGVFGLLVIVPLVRDIMPVFRRWLPFPPFLSDNFTGFSALSAGIVLAIMVLPIIISVAEEVLESVPGEVRDAALSLGATKWEAVSQAVMRKARPGIIAAVILGVSRALGETMAVLMVAGCSLHTLFPRSPFDTAYPLPALIANTYGEMMSIPLYDAAILFAAFMLLIITVIFNMIGWGILIKNIRSEA